MLEVNHMSIKVKDRYIVKDLSFVLNRNDKLAIIGEEGNGKSTLLKGILGICSYAEVTGDIQKKEYRIGYLEQTFDEENLKKTGYDFLFESDSSYYEKVKNFYKWLDVLKINENIIEQEVHTLSGGEKVKLGILKLLLDDNDILFLDEPTNDLDIETLRWLEDFINKVEKPILYVSHDETLLANTANQILHLEQIRKKTDCRWTLLKMGYDAYVCMRLQSINKQTQVAKAEKREYNKQQEKLMKIMQKVEYQQNTVSRKNPHEARVLKKKMHSLKSQEKKLDSVSLTQLPDVEEEIHFFFEDIDLPSRKDILQFDIPILKIKDKILSKNVKLEIRGNMHLCILGKNGVGKSTLIKQIYQELKDRKDIKLGYMPQNYEEILNQYTYVTDFLSFHKSQEEITKARTYLGNMKFTKEEMTGKIKDLSNGTKAKLFLCRFVLDHCNVLILDEPTRNISPLSNPVLRKVLREYQGTIISVSHDRKYIQEVIQYVYTLTEDGLVKSDFPVEEK